jgi:cyclopropane fatty-acyl-phospholipid synthase-like methyltransferase
MTNKPYAPACDRNRDPILAVLREHLPPRAHVLEIGSGTGQHAVHFAAALPHATWQASDRPDHLPGIRMWLDEAALPNTPAPLALDVDGGWPARRFDAIFTANTLHIMGWDDVVRLFERLPSVLADDALFVVYGPFNYGGRFTSDSNAAFDARLKAERPQQGIRDFEAVDARAHAAGLALVADHAMPANNRCIVWRLGARP